MRAPASPTPEQSRESIPHIKDPIWVSAVEAALRDPAEPRLVFQPIVDLQRGRVAGYEVLARFSGPPLAPPDAWFAAADRLGLGARLEARVVHQALRAREELPADCFLTVNVSPHLLGDPDIIDTLLGAGDLRGLVLELRARTGRRSRAAGAQPGETAGGRGDHRPRRCRSGYSGLQQLALIRPELVKIDRALVDHVDRDEIKLALAELLGTYAGRLNAAVIAEGVERPEELEAFIRLGVPLAQGWLFGQPGPGWPTLAGDQARRIRVLAGQGRHGRPAGQPARTHSYRPGRRTGRGSPAVRGRPA